eukprot:SAG11_NODE_632_length_8057_cov_6.472481_2_plen_220_part_00
MNAAHLTDVAHPLTLGCRTEAQQSYAQASHAFRGGYLDFFQGMLDDVRIFTTAAEGFMIHAIFEQEASPVNVHGDGTCSPAFLEAQIDAVQASCCAGHGDGACGDGPPALCTPACATSFLPLYTDCVVHGQMTLMSTPPFTIFAAKCYSPTEFPDCGFADFMPIALLCSDLATGVADMCSSDCISQFGGFMQSCSTSIGPGMCERQRASDALPTLSRLL